MKATEKKQKKTLADFKIDYHKIILIDTEGCKIETYSTYGKEGQEIKLEACPKSHSAWNKDGRNVINTRNDKVAKFNDKYKAFSIDSLKQ